MQQVTDHIKVIKSLDLDKIKEIGLLLEHFVSSGGKILIAGNGGSAADAQHFAAELVGRFKKERKGLPSIALTTDSSIVTAIANDYGYENIFAKQLESLGTGSDIFIGISTSGKSKNIVQAFKSSKSLNVALVGKEANDCGIADFIMTVDSIDTARIQEAHILILHIWAEMIEQKY